MTSNGLQSLRFLWLLDKAGRAASLSCCSFNDKTNMGNKLYVK